MTKPEMDNKPSVPTDEELRGQLLKWYDKYGRDLPWRYKDGATPDPYHVWLSEIMCQQTTVQAVIPYFHDFTQRWPGIQDLAAADPDDIMRAWAGLGYYARARNLLACAQVVVNQYKGYFPQNRDTLKELPGIGDYTSAAIAAIAFNQAQPVLDGNIERVLSRIHAVEEPLPQSKPDLKRHAEEFFQDDMDRPGDTAQALMDLGAMICTPKSPKCPLCPLREVCRAYEKGMQAELPRKIKKQKTPKRYGHIVLLGHSQNPEILLQKRPDKGLLGGMTGFPTTDWQSRKTDFPAIDGVTDLHPLEQHYSVKHVFTHFSLHLKIWRGKAPADFTLDQNEGYYWADKTTFDKAAFPTLFQKVSRLMHENIEDILSQR